MTKHNLIYAGIGSRKTPVPMLAVMTNIARELSPTGWQLRSGHADGADKAFERGAVHKEIHLPWPGYNNQDVGGIYVCPKPSVQICDIAAAHHPKWDELTDAVKLLMCRNVTIVLGLELNTPAKMVICWTPEGRLVGGTAHGIKVAQAFDIPVFNISRNEDQIALCKFVMER
jgi:hypothetical protein